jgi:glycosyltransferase involved in cell wall biosynthesis
MRKHILSIVTVVFNDWENLKATSKSINALKDFFQEELIEHIIWDGNSTDETKDNVRKHFPHSIYQRGSDSGIYDAMNKGTSLARGKYLFYLNAGDEVVLTTKSQMNAFLSELDLNDSDIFIFNTMHTNIQPDGRHTNWTSFANNNIDLLCFGMIFSHQGCTISKNTFDELGGYSTEFGIAGDWHFLNRLYLNEKVFKKIDLTFAKTYPFGVSAELLDRTVERFTIISKLYAKSKKLTAIREMYALFFAIMRNNILPPIKIAEEILKSAPRLDAKSIKSIQAAKNIYAKRNLNGGVQTYGSTNMWHLPKGFEKLNCLEDVNNSKLIFLLSMPRSGSTLFQRLLEGSSQIASTGEPWLCLPILSMFNNDILDHKCDEKLIHKAHEAVAEELELSKDFYKDGIKSYLSKLYDQVLAKTKKQYYLDKTPRYVHIANEIKEYFPGARFIVLTRDPLEIINSYATTWGKSDFKKVYDNPYFSYDFQNGFKQLINFANKHKHDKDVFTLDYSDIIAQKPDILESLRNFLNTQDITYEIKHLKKAKLRSLGDPKTINKTNKIVDVNKIPPVEVAAKIKNPDYLIKILNKIPKSVFDYFKINKQDLIPTSIKPKSLYVKAAEIPNKDKIIPINQPTIKRKDKIGVAITTFNNSTAILKTLQTVGNQILLPDEIIIADDCSTDDTTEQVKNFMSKNPNLPIQLIQRKENIGVSRNRDLALKALDTSFVTHIDGDDTMSPLKIKNEYSAIQSYKADISFSDIKVVNKDSETIQNTR